MIIPSIDLMNGHAVQLVGGRELELDAGDPLPIAERFALAGEIAVVDLDAAIGGGDNRAAIESIIGRAECRVGGGIRDLAAARRWLDAGASKIVLGTAANATLLAQLPRARLIAALDAVDGEVVTHGWRTRTGRNILDCIAELRSHVAGFLITFVEREGRLGGTRLDLVPQLVAAAGDARVTIAGGVSTADEVAELDRLGADAQVGMALYKGHLHLADAFAAPLKSDRADGLWPTVVTDQHGVALGLAYSSGESLRTAFETRSGVYHSRRRGLWTKGASSGATQELLRVDTDCDRDTLRFTVRQSGSGFCHSGSATCWGANRGIAALARTIASRVAEAPPDSYTRRLLDDPALLRAKLLEEAGELSDAPDRESAAGEAADVLYFSLVRLAACGASLSDLEAQLDRRSLRVTRRRGAAKGETR